MRCFVSAQNVLAIFTELYLWIILRSLNFKGNHLNEYVVTVREQRGLGS